MDPITLLLLQGATFVAVVAAVVVASRAVSTWALVRRRLGDAVAGPTQAASGLIKTRDVRSPILQWVEGAFLSSGDDRVKLRADLIQAGFEHPAAPSFYVVIRFGLAIGLPALYILSQALTGAKGGGVAVLMPVMLSGVGLAAPRMFIRQRASARRETIEHQFPDALDLMVVCVEAGLGVDAAFLRVGREIRNSHPQISHELDTLSAELNAGRSRADALRSLADRLDVESIRAFVALLIQTEALGVSIAQALRTFSSEMRETRFLKAEEKAMRIPVLMTIPLVAFLMPVILIALLLPPAIDIIRSFLPAMRS